MKIRNKKYLVLGLILLTLSGCGSVGVLVDTFPTGASLIDMKTNKTLGVSPLRGSVSYSLLEKGEDKECDTGGDVKAVWVSGATAILKNLTVCKKDKFKEFMIYRPSDAPNLDADIKYAQGIQSQKVEMLKAKAMKQQADAADDRNFQQQMQNIQDNANKAQQSIQLMQINNKLKY